MAIGSAILLFVLGAILSFGVSAEFSGIDLQVIGYILMGAGVVGTIIGLITQTNRGTDHQHVVERRTTAPRQGSRDGRTTA